MAATNQDLTAAIREGRFRQDLYFRLAGVTLRLPPLHERREDIVPLAERFWSELQRKYNRNGPGLGREALQRLERAPWPGNVRQLRSAVERYFVLGDLDAALEAPPGPPSPSGALEAAGFREARRLFEAEYLTRRLRQHGGNVTRAAQAAEIDRVYLHRLLRRQKGDAEPAPPAPSPKP